MNSPRRTWQWGIFSSTALQRRRRPGGGPVGAARATRSTEERGRPTQGRDSVSTQMARKIGNSFPIFKPFYKLQTNLNSIQIRISNGSSRTIKSYSTQSSQNNMQTT
jgi:hypothetical protein